MPQPFKVFIIYAREDAMYRNELEGQLRPLQNAGRIKVWSDREINPGAEWENEIIQNLDTADIILMLVSSDYFKSAYIHEKEIKYALARHEKGEAKVLPIIVRPVDFLEDPTISRLQVLPTDGKPVADKRYWAERDDAWLDVVAGVKRTIDSLRAAEDRAIYAAEQARQTEQKATQTALNAAEINRQNQENQREAERERQKAEQKAKEKAEQQQKQREQARAEAENRLNRTPIPSRKYANMVIGLMAILGLIWFIFNRISGPTIETKPELQSTTPAFTSDYELVFVKGGTFQMGSEDIYALDDEKPVHSVTLSDYYIGKTEVTQAEWRSVMGSDPPDLIFKDCDKCPVESVSWDDVQEFLRKLNQKTGKTYRLPTEAEWEYAARGGNHGNAYPHFAGSYNIDAVTWYRDNSDTKTHPVAQKQANELGLYDMSGNVLEWCNDGHKGYSDEYYKNSPRINPPGTASDSYRVIRGGSWFDSSRYCRVSFRNYKSPDFRLHDIGFRLAMTR
jgi:formylglycine-generating enzyme required for sulfatase activity